jgi:hypothetical protein
VEKGWLAGTENGTPLENIWKCRVKLLLRNREIGYSDNSLRQCPYSSSGPFLPLAVAFLPENLKN